MSTVLRLQACHRSLKPTRFRNTPFTAHNLRTKRMIDASKDRSELKGYPCAKYKFRWKKENTK